MSRTGRFAYYELALGSHTVSSVYVLDVQSNIDLGGYVGMWLHRRGFLRDGTRRNDWDERDRQRRIKLYTPASAKLDVDRPWVVPPIEHEMIEVCHLDPIQVIRPAVIRGLARIKFRDRQPVTLASAAAERNLAALTPWITDESQVVDIAHRDTGSLWAPTRAQWFNTFSVDGAPWITLGQDPFPQTLYVTSIREGHTLVNGAYSATGPTDDDDEIAPNISLARAAAAGTIECWRTAAHLLTPLAERKLIGTQKEAADEHTRQQRRRNVRKQTRWQLSAPLYSSMPQV